MENQESYDRAKKVKGEKKGFFSHLAVYVIVNVILIVLNLTRSPESLWFFWPLLGWGIGLFFHGMDVFVWGKKGS